MREEITYIADDGTRFASEYECEKYERNLKYRDVIKNKELTMWNYKKRKIDDVQDCYYLKCDSIDACRYFIELSDEEGLPTPFEESLYGHGEYEIGKGCWMYNGDTDDWESLEELEMRIKELKELFK